MGRAWESMRRAWQGMGGHGEGMGEHGKGMAGHGRAQGTARQGRLLGACWVLARCFAGCLLVAPGALGALAFKVLVSTFLGAAPGLGAHLLHTFSAFWL